MIGGFRIFGASLSLTDSAPLNTTWGLSGRIGANTVVLQDVPMLVDYMFNPGMLTREIGNKRTAIRSISWTISLLNK